MKPNSQELSEEISTKIFIYSAPPGVTERLKSALRIFYSAPPGVTETSEISAKIFLCSPSSGNRIPTCLFLFIENPILITAHPISKIFSIGNQTSRSLLSAYIFLIKKYYLVDPLGVVIWPNLTEFYLFDLIQALKSELTLKNFTFLIPGYHLCPYQNNFKISLASNLVCGGDSKGSSQKFRTTFISRIYWLKLLNTLVRNGNVAHSSKKLNDR